MAEEYSTVKVVGGVGFLAILVILGTLMGGVFSKHQWPFKPPDPVPCPSGGGPGCASKKAAGEPASDGSTCESGYVCQAVGANCGPSNAGSCTTIPLGLDSNGKRKCGCICAL